MRFCALTSAPEVFSMWFAHMRQPAGAPAPAVPPPAAARTASRAKPAAAPGTPATPAPVQAGFAGFDRAKMPAYAWPRTPIPDDLKFDTTIVGDAARGAQTVASGTC